MASPKKVVVNIISDVACPWCWVGKRAIETAAANINAAKPGSVELELRWLPFEIRPDVEPGTTVNLAERFAARSGDASAVDGWITEPSTFPPNAACTEEGLENIHFIFSRDSIGFNTYRAHTLLTYAGKVLGDYQKQNALKEAMLRMTHGESKNLDKAEELLAAAKEARVADSADEVARILADDAVKKILDEELQASYEVTNISGVPHFTFSNGKQMLEGKSVSEFENMLRENAV